MVSTKNHSPKDGESNSNHDKKLAQGMDGAKIIRQKDGWVESYMVSTKITHQRLEN